MLLWKGVVRTCPQVGHIRCLPALAFIGALRTLKL